MIGLIPLPYKILALAIVAIGIYFTGRSHGLEKYYELKANVEAQSAALAAEAERRRKESEQASVDAASGWAAAVDFWRSTHRVVTVRVPANCDSGGLRPVPGTPGQPQPAPAEPRSGSVVDVAECEARLNNAIRDAAQVEHIRQWIIDQRRASNAAQTNN